MDFLELKSPGYQSQKISFFFFKRRNCYLAIAAYLKTFFSTSITLWERLFKKLKFQLKEKYVF